MRERQREKEGEPKETEIFILSGESDLTGVCFISVSTERALGTGELQDLRYRHCGSG